MCKQVGMLFVLVMFYKCATCSVVCEIWRCCHVPWCKRGEAIEKDGGGCCLRADHGMGIGCVGKIGGVLCIQVRA